MEEKSLPIRSFLEPKLRDVLLEGINAGFEREEVLAVMIDLLDDTNLEDIHSK